MSVQRRAISRINGRPSAKGRCEHQLRGPWANLVSKQNNKKGYHVKSLHKRRRNWRCSSGIRCWRTRNYTCGRGRRNNSVHRLHMVHSGRKKQVKMRPIQFFLPSVEKRSVAKGVKNRRLPRNPSIFAPRQNQSICVSAEFRPTNQFSV